MIGILNLDIDESPLTNGAHILHRMLPDSEIVDICHDEIIIDLDRFDAFILTGSRANFDDDAEWMRYTREALRQIHARRIPCLCICLGMQIAADIFGGTVQRNAGKETGFLPLDTGTIPGMPESCMVYQSHYDAVIALPPRAELLAENEHIQAFSLGSLVCVQFHPEVSAEIARMMAERDGNDPVELLNGVAQDYELPRQLIAAFVQPATAKE